MRGAISSFALLACLAACDSGEPRDAAVAVAIAVAPASPAAAPPARGSDTNIFAADYVGPDTCGGCHADPHARWEGSLHRVMNARAGDPRAVVGDFAGTRLAYGGGTATFAREGAAYTMTLRRGDTTRRYVVTRTIGHRGLQEYVGREGGTGDEVRLPFGWWPRGGGWAAQPDFDPWLGEARGWDPYAKIADPWAQRCPWCHSTYPFALRIARDKGHGLDQFFAPGSGAGSAADRLDVAQQVTVGISCESCHLGGRAHATTGAPIQLVPRGATPRPGAPEATTFARERTDAAIVNGVCAQCHSGPSPRLPDGTALRNSSEALDLAASPCTGIKCTDCHDPHRADGTGPELAARAIAACTHCHQVLADPVAARAHAGPHAEGGTAAASCLDCHMPRVVLGIDRYVRTHRISSPASALAAGAPDACSLCHLDRPTSWTASALADEPWQVHLDPRARRLSDVPAGEAYLRSREPSYRLIAAAAYARAGQPARIAPLLSDPLPYVRAWARLLTSAPPCTSPGGTCSGP